MTLRAVLAALLLAVLAVQAEAPPSAPDEVGSLVEALGDPVYEKREAAQRRLASLGSQVTPRLMAAFQHEDPEVRSRAERIIGGFITDAGGRDFGERVATHPGGGPKERYYAYTDAGGQEVRHGPYRSFHEDGSPHREGMYRHGAREGTHTTLHPNGNVKARFTYRSEADYAFATFLEDGLPETAGEKKGGERHGTQTRWRPGGGKMFEARFEVGVPEGGWTFWAGDGRVLCRLEWKGGARVSCERWNEKGAPLFPPGGGSLGPAGGRKIAGGKPGPREEEVSLTHGEGGRLLLATAPGRSEFRVPGSEPPEPETPTWTFTPPWAGRFRDGKDRGAEVEFIQSRRYVSGRFNDLVFTAALGAARRDLSATVSCVLDRCSVYRDLPVHDAVYRAIQRPDAEELRAFLAKKPDVGARDENGATPLLFAVHGRAPEAVRALLEAGADVNAGAGGWTPLHEAVWTDEPELLRLLLDKGADPAAKDGRGRTPLDLALESGRLDAAARLMKE